MITGPSGSGKDEVIRLLREVYPHFQMVTTAVTREPRPGEQPGITHHFLSSSEFDEWKNCGKFLEWAQVYGRKYGTPRSEVVGPITQGQDVLLRVDIQGAKSVKKTLRDAVVIFIAPPSVDELSRRLHSRSTESPLEIENRLERLSLEMTFREQCDYVVINETGRQKQTAIRVGAICRLVRKERQESCFNSNKDDFETGEA